MILPRPHRGAVGFATIGCGGPSYDTDGRAFAGAVAGELRVDLTGTDSRVDATSVPQSRRSVSRRAVRRAEQSFLIGYPASVTLPFRVLYFPHDRRVITLVITPTTFTLVLLDQPRPAWRTVILCAQAASLFPPTEEPVFSASEVNRLPRAGQTNKNGY